MRFTGSMKVVPIPVLQCYRCHWAWTPKNMVVRMCPNCKSTLWDVPRKRKTNNVTAGLGVRELIDPKRRQLLRIARQYGLRHLRVFGSVARGEATESSDIDLLVSGLKKSARVGQRTRAERELCSLFGRRVDLVIERNLHWLIRTAALSEATVL
jgi:uncharacterized protein